MPAHIGLIGGIGPAATDYYYRKIIAAYAESGLELELTIAHADAPTLLRRLRGVLCVAGGMAALVVAPADGRVSTPHGCRA